MGDSGNQPHQSTMRDMASSEELRQATIDLVVSYMNQNDSSHDAAHIVRVTRNARQIYLAEVEAGRLRPSDSISTRPSSSNDLHSLDSSVEAINWPLVYYSSLLHDLFDAKYAAKGPLVGYSSLSDYLNTALGFPVSEAAAIQHVCDHVSFSKQKKQPDLVANVLAGSPALRIVQDADRLDAIGAVGIARTFCFTGMMDGKGMAKGGGPLNSRGLGETIAHFHEKLLHLEGIMNTQSGKTLARKRTQRMQMFLEWWEDEVGESCYSEKDLDERAQATTTQNGVDSLSEASAIAQDARSQLHALWALP